MTNSKVLIKNSKLIIDETDSEMIVFNEETGNTHILNSTGCFLFKNSENITCEDLINLLFDSLDDESKKMGKEQILKDCEPFVNDMINNKIIMVKGN